MQKLSQTALSQDICSEDSMAGGTESVGATAEPPSFPNSGEKPRRHQQLWDEDEIEDAEREHKLSQVRLELFRGQ